jgi:ATP-dependent exoDNAse (exonuclease V) alpha subunit
MAIFHMEIRPIKRSSGQQATGAAAYRAGESIRDERTGNVHNHSRRKDVRHTEIILPSKLDASTAAWAQDRARLWNTAEAAEKRRNSRVAREYEVALPPELTPDQRLALARTFSRELADRYGVAVDLAIHDPKPGRESTNYHAHILTTTREATPKGLGTKVGLDMASVARAQRGLSSHSEEYSTLRERWATLTNQALREANIEARVDHRSLAAQGIDRKPLLHVPFEFYQLERKGMPKEAAERLREDYRARLTAFRERSGETKAAQTEPAQTKSEAALSRRDGQHARAVQSAEPDATTVVPRNSEEVRRRAVQAWLRMRSKEGESTREESNQTAVARGKGEERDR